MALVVSNLKYSTFEYARNLLASVPTLLDEVFGGVSPSQAKEKIYWLEALDSGDAEEHDIYPGDSADEKPAIEPRPRVIVVSNGRSSQRIGTGEWSGTGSLWFVFEIPSPAEHLVDPEVDDSETQRIKARNRKEWGSAIASRIESELQVNSGRSDGALNPFLNIKTIELAVEPGDSEEEEIEQFIAFALIVGWE